MQRVVRAEDTILRSGCRAECMLHNALGRGDGGRTNRSRVVIARCRRLACDCVGVVSLSRIPTDRE